MRKALASIGFDRLKGYADPSIVDEASNVESYEQITSEELQNRMDAGSVHVVDVRNQNEWYAGHIPDAKHIMLGYLPDRTDEIPTDKDVVVHCQSGKRSAIAASVLQKHGITNVIN